MATRLHGVTSNHRWMALWLAVFWLPMALHAHVTHPQCAQPNQAGDACSAVMHDGAAACSSRLCGLDGCHNHRHACEFPDGRGYAVSSRGELPVTTTARIESPSAGWPCHPVAVSAIIGLSPPKGRLPGLPPQPWQFVLRAAAAPRAPSAV